MFTDGISNKFSFYDQIGYLLVGSIALLLIAGNMWLTNGSESLPSFALQIILVWMVVAYFLGHLVQSVANIIIIEKKDSYTISGRNSAFRAANQELSRFYNLLEVDPFFRYHRR